MIDNFMVAYYKDGSSVMRGDFVTTHLEDPVEGKPVLLQVHGETNEIDKQRFKKAVDPKVGKVEYV